MYRMFNPMNAGDDVGVDFDLEVNGVVQHFLVSSEAIEDLTKLSKLQRKHGSPSNGRILLKTSDF